jgi:acetyl esterase/lipase
VFGWVRGVVVGVCALVCLGAALAAGWPWTASTSGDQTQVHRAYPVGNGNNVYAYWHRGQQNAPWIVLVHGGYWRAGGGNDASLIAWARREQRRGFATFSIDYRLVPHVRWPTPERDVVAAVRWIRARADVFGLDLRRGFIAGGSAGGLMASVVALDTGGFAGVITMAGAVDPYDEYSHDPNPVLRVAALALMGGRTPTQAPALWHDARAVNHLGRHRMPFLLVHSTHDRIVNIRTAKRFRAQLQAHDYSVRIAIRPGRSHSLRSPQDIGVADSWMTDVLAGRVR